MLEDMLFSMISMSFMRFQDRGGHPLDEHTLRSCVVDMLSKSALSDIVMGTLVLEEVGSHTVAVASAKGPAVTTWTVSSRRGR